MYMSAGISAGSNHFSKLTTMAPGRVLAPLDEAAKAAAKMKDLYPNRTEQDELGNGAVELLREVLTKVSIDEQYPELLRVVAFMQTLLASLRGHLQEWGWRAGPNAWLDLPFCSLPKKFPNDCWTMQHPCPDTFAREVKSCVGFLAAHLTCLAGPAWDWLRDTFEVLDSACTSSMQQGEATA